MATERIVVAFENQKSCERIREILESSDVADCLICRSASEVKRLVGSRHINTIVCGFKFPDQTAEELFEDLPPASNMLMLAGQNLLELCQNEDIFKLPSPVGRKDLVETVKMLLRLGRRFEKFVRPQRSEEERLVILEAKVLLMDRHGMSEEQAHRLLQNQSMDSGGKLVETAKAVLEDG